MSIGSFRGFQQGVVNPLTNLKISMYQVLRAYLQVIKINSPFRDDIGGLSVSSRMNTDRISTAQGSKNVGEAISIL